MGGFKPSIIDLSMFVLCACCVELIIFPSNRRDGAANIAVTTLLQKECGPDNVQVYEFGKENARVTSFWLIQGSEKIISTLLKDPGVSL